MSAVEQLSSSGRPDAELLLRDMRVLDPRDRIDARLDVRVERGEIAEIADGATLAGRDGLETIEGGGRLMLARRSSIPTSTCAPGQEHKETWRPARAPPQPGDTGA